MPNEKTTFERTNFCRILNKTGKYIMYELDKKIIN